MTREETLKVLAMLNAFYAGGKNDPQQQLAAWHLILQKYDYEIAKKAVINFAENDVRQYATFPAVGVIVAEIRRCEAEMEKPIKEIVRAVAYGYDYTQLSYTARSRIREATYNEWLAMDAEEYASKMDVLADSLKNHRQKRLEG